MTPESKKMTSIHLREIRFDILRFIAIVCIIFAHVDPPKWMFQIRNFDVPLIVLVSGAVFSFSSGALLSYKDYLKKRVLRIVLPVWIFFTFYFIFSALFAFSVGVATPFSLQTILMTYLFQVSLGGIAYVWILYVFTVMAFLMPFLYRIHSRIQKDSHYLLGLLAFFLVYVFIFHLWSIFSPSLSPILVESFELDVLTVFPYLCLVAFGLRFPSFSYSTIQKIMIGSFIIFAILAAYYHHFSFPQYMKDVVWTQKFKYPPQPYFLSYALFISCTLFLFFSRWQPKFSWLTAFIIACSRSTLWIYLWHVFYLSVSKHLPWDDHPFQRFPFVLFFSIGTALLQSYFAKRFIQQFPEKRGWKYALLQHLI